MTFPGRVVDHQSASSCVAWIVVVFPSLPVHSKRGCHCQTKNETIDKKKRRKKGKKGKKKTKKKRKKNTHTHTAKLKRDLKK